MGILAYIFGATLCLSVFYIFYQLLFRNEVRFKLLRFYLLASAILSMGIPMNRSHIDLFSLFKTKTDHVSIVMKEIKAQDNDVNQVPKENRINCMRVVSVIYLSIASMLLVRMLIQMGGLLYHITKSTKQKQGKFIFVYNDQFKNTFSFLNWIFIHQDNQESEDLEQIVLHEKIHASQYHSIDLIIFELLSAVMWFNPLIWMMKNSIQLVHEYLADEGVLSTGIDKLKYQALLINQVSEEKLICISSKFNHSLIKKRMIMMTKSKFNQRSNLRIFTLFPVSAILFVAIACLNSIFAPSAVASSVGDQFGTSVLATRQVVTNQGNSNPQVGDTTQKLKIRATNQPAIGKQTPKINYILNGEPIANLDQIPTDSIESVNVLKGDNLIVVRTKSYAAQKNVKPVTSQVKPNLLYIIDGKEQDEAEFNELNQETIEKIDVIKDQSKKKYTDKNYDGVLIITTSKKNK